MACLWRLGSTMQGGQAGILTIKNLRRDGFTLRLVYVVSEPLMFYMMEHRTCHMYIDLRPECKTTSLEEASSIISYLIEMILNLMNDHIKLKLIKLNYFFFPHV